MFPCVTANDFQEKLRAPVIRGAIPTDSVVLDIWGWNYEGTFISMYNWPWLAELLCDTAPRALGARAGNVTARVKRSHFSPASYLYRIKRRLLRWILRAVFCLHNNRKGRKILTFCTGNLLLISTSVSQRWPRDRVSHAFIKHLQIMRNTGCTAFDFRWALLMCNPSIRSYQWNSTKGELV